MVEIDISRSLGRRKRVLNAKGNAWMFNPGWLQFFLSFHHVLQSIVWEMCISAVPGIGNCGVDLGIVICGMRKCRFVEVPKQHNGIFQRDLRGTHVTSAGQSGGKKEGILLIFLSLSELFFKKIFCWTIGGGGGKEGILLIFLSWSELFF